MPAKRKPHRSLVGLELTVGILTSAVKELHWMARRYADNRYTYATSSFNSVTRTLLALGIKLDGSDGIIWARDGQGRFYDHLSSREALGICGTAKRSQGL